MPAAKERHEQFVNHVILAHDDLLNFLLHGGVGGAELFDLFEILLTGFLTHNYVGFAGLVTLFALPLRSYGYGYLRIRWILGLRIQTAGQNVEIQKIEGEISRLRRSRGGETSSPFLLFAVTKRALIALP